MESASEIPHTVVVLVVLSPARNLSTRQVLGGGLLLSLTSRGCRWKEAGRPVRQAGLGARPPRFVLVSFSSSAFKQFFAPTSELCCFCDP